MTIGSLSTTYVVATAHLLLSLAAIALTRYPVITTFHVVLASHALGFGVRPILAALAGGYTLYPVALGPEAYNRGLMYELVFILSYVLGYMLFRRRIKGPIAIHVNTTHITRAYHWSTVVGLASVLVIHLLSRGTWLPTARSSSITAAVPFGKLLFPLAVIPLSISIPLAYLVWQQGGKARAILPLTLGLSLVLLSLLYQRSFILHGFVLVLFFYERFRYKERMRLGYARAAAVAVFLIVLLGVLRPVTVTLLQQHRAVEQHAADNTLLGAIQSFLLFSPNFDSPDVFSVAIQYLEGNKPLLGKTFLAVPLRFTTPNLRHALGIGTATDTLNVFYWGDKYWTTRFGFAVGLPQELVINFGAVLLILGFIPGMATAMVDRWIWGLKYIRVSSVYALGAAFFAWGFTGDIAGTVQWGVAYLLLASAFNLVARVRLSSRSNCGAMSR